MIFDLFLEFPLHSYKWIVNDRLFMETFLADGACCCETKGRSECVQSTEVASELLTWACNRFQGAPYLAIHKVGICNEGVLTGR